MLDPWSRHSCSKKSMVTVCLPPPLPAGCKDEDEWVPAGVTAGWIVVTLLADLRKAPAVCATGSVTDIRQGWWLGPGSFQRCQPSLSSSTTSQAQPREPLLCAAWGSCGQSRLGQPESAIVAVFKAPCTSLPPSRTLNVLARYEKCLHPNSSLLSTSEEKDGMPVPQVPQPAAFPDNWSCLP